MICLLERLEQLYAVGELRTVFYDLFAGTVKTVVCCGRVENSVLSFCLLEWLEQLYAQIQWSPSQKELSFSKHLLSNR